VNKTSKSAKNAGGTTSKKRVHAKSIERRQRILDAAAKALAEYGYAEAKLSDIAKDAGTHAGSLYYYFSSRDELVKEVLHSALDKMYKYEQFIEVEMNRYSPLDGVFAYVRLLLEKSSSSHDFYYRAFMRNADQLPQDIHNELRTHRHQMRLTIARLLSEAQTVGQVSLRIDPDVTAQFIIGAATWAISWYKPSGRYNVNEISELFTDLIRGGIEGKKAKAR
jgi:TetR/AcrR family transcriptional regulator, cholesterol catabolism regulator